MILKLNKVDYLISDFQRLKSSSFADTFILSGVPLDCLARIEKLVFKISYAKISIIHNDAEVIKGEFCLFDNILFFEKSVNVIVR